MLARRSPSCAGRARARTKQKNSAVAKDLFRKGAGRSSSAEEYGRAYDEFTKAYEVSGDPAMLWNRAQSLRLLGGRRAETIAFSSSSSPRTCPRTRRRPPSGTSPSCEDASQGRGREGEPVGRRPALQQGPGVLHGRAVRPGLRRVQQGYEISQRSRDAVQPRPGAAAVGGRRDAGDRPVRAVHRVERLGGRPEGGRGPSSRTSWPKQAGTAKKHPDGRPASCPSSSAASALGEDDDLVARLERDLRALPRVHVDAVRPGRVARLGADPVADRDLVEPARGLDDRRDGDRAGRSRRSRRRAAGTPPSPRRRTGPRTRH